MCSQFIKCLWSVATIQVWYIFETLKMDEVKNQFGVADFIVFFG